MNQSEKVEGSLKGRLVSRFWGLRPSEHKASQQVVVDMVGHWCFGASRSGARSWVLITGLRLVLERMWIIWTLQNFYRAELG